ncbi:MAG: hypothetical protein ACKV2Q_35625 [Planctomycetaceae bacterium]
MPEATVEQRLITLESQMQELMSRLGQPKREKDWRRTVGMFADQLEMQRVFDEAQRLREEDRQRFYAEFDREQATK